jgi:ribosomal protein S18 acetylase RimI-like enzyme
VFAELQKIGKPITLNVNEANTRALACYQKNGFEIVRQELIDLGNGMINRDLILQKR